MDTSILLNLFEKHFNSQAVSLKALPLSGSARRYFRLTDNVNTCIGAFNPDINENMAFIYFSKHFLSKQLSVAKILEIDKSSQYYLMEDLGDITLKDFSDKIRTGIEVPDELLNLYKKALDELINFQISGNEGLDYSHCVPRSAYDRQSILWDLNHFKYFFLKLSGIPFNEQGLEDDFQIFANFLSGADANTFLFRDFQSRNILLHNNKLYFIDYQGGRKGALQYDPASLLFEAKTNLPPELRYDLLNYYIDKLLTYRKTTRKDFLDYYYPFAMIRILQALGAYGLRGIIEKKPVFMQSIPFALRNIEWILNNTDIPVKIPEMTRVLRQLINHDTFTLKEVEASNLLTIRVFSFSYRKGIPDDLTGNGGGFVFDCRGIHNPGRYPEYIELTGKDEPVQNFLINNSKMNELLNDVNKLIARHIAFCKENSYSHMQVSFGCTGGRHRSVYAAEKTTEALNNRHDVRVILQHSEI